MESPLKNNENDCYYWKCQYFDYEANILYFWYEVTRKGESNPVGAEKITKEQFESREKAKAIPNPYRNEVPSRNKAH